MNRACLVLLALLGCTKEQPAPPPAPPPAQPAPAATVPPSAAPQGNALSGTVVETMNAGGYTYVKLDRGDGTQVWVAGPETNLSPGVKLGSMDGMLMSGFRSDTLKRTFDQIYFVNAFPVSGSAMPNPHGAPAAAEPIEKIAPVAGGTTVADVFAGKAKLAGKEVAVHGKVTKVNNGILGHNWLHVQDGSGSAGTNDLVVTTSATVNKGDDVVVRGKVSVDKDFGAGYTYSVLVEDATVSK